MAAKAIHHSVPGQLSSHINEDYPLFVEFLSGYYEWLESGSSPYTQIKNHLSALDFKESIDAYTSMLKNEYLHTIPERVIANKELLIKHSKQFFQSLGTEKSFLFKILYGEDVELYYPKTDILRASDAHWIDNESMMYVSNSGNVNNFLYRRITQKRELAAFPGQYEYAYATVNRIINRYANKFNFAELYLTDIQGEFKLTHPVTVDDVNVEWILPIADSVEINSPGLNYVADNTMTWAGDSHFELVLTATEPGYIDTRYTTLFNADELTVSINGATVSNFTYDGKTVQHPDILPSVDVTVRWPVYKGFIIVSSVDALGGILDVALVDTPFGIVTPQLLQADEGGSGGSVTLIPSVTRKIDGYFMTTDSFLSSDKMLQDSEYYQDYSYVIRAGIDVEKYRDIVLQVLHPAGLKMYGEVNIIEFIKLIIRDESFDIIVNFAGEIEFLSAVPLYNRYGFVEDFKHAQTSETYKVNDFKHMVVGDVMTKFNKPLNYHFSNIEYNEGPYSDPTYVDDDYVVDAIYHTG
ncbi:hypothetical protein pf16_212 [Pseudomonas phage pf16]|uniref:Uncharacterized protein n=1 Tax=Pseudomonas phage pf16 TaxID=1815630 RepID=A0A1S5R473_9CAUD|nr:hypothetical protein FDG98_gp086 [Pseudomonas phage pf16]AND75135.1 hypothetical protein pf16_212 [Pseudomonas phage pf16]